MIHALKTKFIHFFRHTIWMAGNVSDNAIKKYLFKYLRIIISSIFKFHKDEGFIRVGAMTYYTINALVPLLALMLWVTARFAINQDFLKILMNVNPQQKDLIQNIYHFAENTIHALSNKLVFFIGLGFLLWSVFSIMNSIENAFNDVWSVGRGRAIIKKIFVHFSTVLLLPFAIVISISTTIAMKEVVIDFLSKISIIDSIPFDAIETVRWFSITLNYFLLVGLFSLLYFIFPNRKMRYSSAFAGGVVAAILFMIFERFYIQSQIGVSRANTIFGSFAAIPLFLMWMYFSWMIILYGCYISFHTETYPAFTSFVEEKISIIQLKKLAVGIYRHIEVEGERRTLRALSQHELSENFLTSAEQIQLAIRYLIDADLIAYYDKRSETYCLALLGRKYSNKEIEDKIETLYSDQVTLVIKHDFTQTKKPKLLPSSVGSSLTKAKPNKKKSAS